MVLRFAVLRFAVTSALALGAAGCIAGALPPTRSDIGTTMQQPKGELRTGVRMSAGAHLASGTLNAAQKYDVGVGYVYESVEAGGRDIGDAATHGTAPQTSHGAYLSAARLVSNQLRENHRTWLELRVEFLRSSEAGAQDSVGVLARGTWEIFGAGEGGGGFSDNCGGGAGYAVGTTALGLYIEGGPRRTFENKGSFSATAGVSVRLPFLFGFAYNLCPD